MVIIPMEEEPEDVIQKIEMNKIKLLDTTKQYQKLDLHDEEQLKSIEQKIRFYVEAMEHINNQMDTLKEDLKELFKEMRDNDINVKSIKQVVADRKEDPDEIKMFYARLKEYKEYMGVEIWN
jgi:uncharacterized protein (UPF0335 family)